MPVKSAVTVLVGSAVAITTYVRPAFSEPHDDRAPVEFLLVHPQATASMDVDIWEDANPELIRKAHQDLLEIRRPLPQAADPRQTFFGALRSGFSLLPVVGQFANQDWVKGLLLLGTGAGLATGIYLGDQRGDPELKRLGTLGLYPLVVFSMFDAYGTARHRAGAVTPASVSGD